MPTTLPARPPQPAPPDEVMPPLRLDDHVDQIVARLTARLAARPPESPLREEAAHEFLVLGCWPDAPAERGC